ncbi:hypothetical protein HD554DRAFT_2096594 [Boletus coccyginus]|nr:hypothetical protein HD554DRAFT_2096594 [Boletus coccyginus]
MTQTTCLSRTTYSPKNCDEYVGKLYRCCREMYSIQGAESMVCPLKPVVERWSKRHESEIEERRCQVTAQRPCKHRCVIVSWWGFEGSCGRQCLLSNDRID